MNLRSRLFEAPNRGQTNSNDYNSFQDLILGDLSALNTEVASNTSAIAKALQILVDETRANTEEIQRLKQWRQQELQIAADLGLEHTYFHDWRRIAGSMWSLGTTTIPQTQRLRLDTPYGQAVIPYNELAERLVLRNLDNDELITHPSVTTNVIGTSETGAEKVITGTPSNALNGINESYWVREVRYLSESDVEEVKCQIQIDVPTSQVNECNQLVIHPYPSGKMDIEEILYSTDGTAPSLVMGTDLDVYPDPDFPINDSSYIRLFFAPTTITGITVKLRQRNYSIRNGWKSFRYGLQEIALRLVNYDTYDPGTNPSPGDGHSVITKVDVPSGYYFNRITGFWCTPNFKTASSGWPIYYKIFTDAALSNQVWRSYSDNLPQDQYVDVSSNNTSSLYIVTTAAYNSTKSVPAILENFALRFNIGEI